MRNGFLIYSLPTNSNFHAYKSIDKKQSVTISLNIKLGTEFGFYSIIQ